MKTQLVIFIVLIIFSTSCVTTRVTTIPNNSSSAIADKDRLQILGKAEGSSGGGRVWILFIPLGWAKDSWLVGRAYKKALNVYPNADGLLDQTQSYHRTTIPLILITPQVKTTKVEGTAYHIRSDAELVEYLKSKNQ